MDVVNRRTVISSILLSLFIFGALGVATSAGPSWKTSTNSSGPTISIYIEEAYYGDFDDDGYEDDTYARTELYLSGANRYNFDYWVTLTLPSGDDFTFGWVVNTRLTFLNVSNTMYDTALEPGWYHLHIEVVMKTGGVSYTDAEVEFDPPGGGFGGTNPQADFTLL